MNMSEELHNRALFGLGGAEYNNPLEDSFPSSIRKLLGLHRDSIKEFLYSVADKKRFMCDVVPRSFAEEIPQPIEFIYLDFNLDRIIINDVYFNKQVLADFFQQDLGLTTTQPSAISGFTVKW